MTVRPAPALAAAVLLLATGPLSARQPAESPAAGDTDDSELLAAPEARRRPPALEGGRLTGPGAELLLEEVPPLPGGG